MTAAGASSSGAGISRSVRDRREQQEEARAGTSPIAPTQMRLVHAEVVAMTPPRTWPIGIVPHTMKRIVAFIRPCIRGRA